MNTATAENKIVYTASAHNFSKIPGSPIAYWVSKNFVKNYNNKAVSNYAQVITGMTIGDNNKYLRFWYELNFSTIAFGKRSMNEINLSRTKWIPYSKGGTRRNWYGNYEHVVDWSGRAKFNRSKTTLQHLYLLEAVTWPFITPGTFSAKILPQGSLWDVAGSPCFFKSKEMEYYCLGLLCSKCTDYILKVVNPTINVQAADIAQIPCIVEQGRIDLVNNFVTENMELSRYDWDAFETSWDFKKHPLI